MTKKRLWLLLSCVATLLWIAFIFGNSMQSGAESGATSDTVTEWVNEVVGTLFPGFHISGYLIRKLAHFLEFALLSLLFCLDLTLLFSLRRKTSIRKAALVLLAIPASAIIAMADETIQLFSDGRGPSLKDVLIDTCGAAFACLIFFGVLCLMRLRRSRRDKPSNK